MLTSRYTRTALLTVGTLIASLCGACSGPVLDEAQLLKRCAESVPEWDDYDEDLKAQIGAAPIALWRGQLLEAAHEGDSLELNFALSEPWAHLKAQVPILLRTPEGHVIRSTSILRQEDKVIYYFQGEELSGRFPWVEVRYPRTERRVYLN